MKLIIITSEALFVEREVESIHYFFEQGLDFLHVRKPQASRAEYVALLERIDPKWHGHIVVHDYPDLVHDYALAGWQLNGRNKPCASLPLPFSGGAHSLSELQVSLAQCQSYCFLSPIYTSISKEGYQGAFTEAALRSASLGERVVALGGITLEHISSCRALGFGGVALLGLIWGTSACPLTYEERVQRFAHIQFALQQ